MLVVLIGGAILSYILFTPFAQPATPTTSCRRPQIGRLIWPAASAVGHGALGRFPCDAVAWFRDDAGEPVAKMWDIVALLREHGVDVRLLRSANPGRVVYEDRVQVLVDEWNRL